MALVKCIDHIRTFNFLMKKTYWCEISDEEAQVRDTLAQSIRADFNILQAKLNSTFLGITYSKWSGDDYKRMVELTKSMQQSLISIHSNLTRMKQSEAKVYIDQVLASGPVNFDLLRKYIYVGLTEVQKELAVGPESASYYIHEAELLKEIDLERQGSKLLLRSSTRKSTHAESQFSSRTTDAQDAASQLRDVENNIALEVSDRLSELITVVPDSPSPLESPSTPSETFATLHDFTVLQPRSTNHSLKNLTHSARVSWLILRLWNNLQILQQDIIGNIYTSGKVYQPEEPLLLECSMDSFPREVTSHGSNPPSNRLSDGILTEQDRSHFLGPILRPTSHFQDLELPKSPSSTTSEPRVDEKDNDMNKDELHRSLIRTYSHSFIMGLFLKEFIELREFVTGQGGQPRKKKVHFSALAGLRRHFRSQRPANSAPENSYPTESHLGGDMSIREALETLKGRRYVPRKISFFERILYAEKLVRSPDSICAFKVACGVTILAVLFWCETTRDFAVRFNLNTAILPIVVSITPTLGQSWLSFMFQISGQGMGLLYGMIVLEIFRDIGGYKYNPYGIISAMALFSIPVNYILYTNPQLFVMSVLSLNSAATLIYPIYLNQRVPFDSPSYRMAKSLTSLAIAIGIVTSFQLFVLRNPARRTLRKAIAKVMKANTAYTVILQAYVSSTIPTDPRHRPPLKAIRRVAKDLKKREVKIQDDLTALMPLIKFSGAEPSFVNPFDAAEYLKIIRANQLILDRNRDARIAIGTSPLPEEILKEFVEKLAYYRAPALSGIKTSLYLCTSALSSKFPLPETVNYGGRPKSGPHIGTEILHDALVLAFRLASSPNGLRLVKSPDLTRYWVYLCSINSVFDQLEAIQDSTKKLYGKLEDETFNYYSL